jgi:hygromycin-B 4-O-kinase
MQHITATHVRTFLTKHTRAQPTEIVSLSGGEWSQAFGYKQHTHDYVIRFGTFKNDYTRDQQAIKYNSPSLPIPKVLEIGEAFDGYFAISERAFGLMLEDMNTLQMRSLLPSIFETLDALRTADISQTQGYGEWNADEIAPFTTWYELLVGVQNENPAMKFHNWKQALADSPTGDKPFQEAFKVLKEIARDIPCARSLVHNDLLHFNVLANGDHITAVFDWANSLYGDFLYDLAQFVFWADYLPATATIDWKQEALSHYQTIGLSIPKFEERLTACMLNMGLGAQSYLTHIKSWEMLDTVAKHTLKVARSVS